MERLPYIDEHGRRVGVSREAVWRALVERRPRTGFVVEEARAPERLSLVGRHPFSRYRLVFELDEPAPGTTLLRAITYAVFPGPHGRLYRALVIGSGGHRVMVRRMLRQIAPGT